MYKDYSYQIITRDGKVSEFPDKASGYKWYWNDHRIPEGTQVSKVEMLNCKETSCLKALMFFGRDESVLLKAGLIKFPG